MYDIPTRTASQTTPEP
jgi:hypothetical protein